MRDAVRSERAQTLRGDVVFDGGREKSEGREDHWPAALDFTNGRDVRAMYGVVLCAKKLREYAEGGRAEGRSSRRRRRRLLQRSSRRMNLYWSATAAQGGDVVR